MIDIRLSAEAHRIFEKFCADTEISLRHGHELEHMPDWGSKYPGAVARIAGNLHAVECAHKGIPLDTPISASTLRSAISIGMYFKAHSIAAFGFMAADRQMLDAQDLLKRLDRHSLKVSERDLWRSAKNKFDSDRERFKAALNVLRDHHFIRIITIPSGGRPSEEIQINPRYPNIGDKSA